VDVPNREPDFVLDLAFVREVVAVIGVLPRVPDDDERREFKFDRAVFENAIVMPWYRNRETPHYYYVAEVCNCIRHSLI
jgi:endoribonuclease Dicer